MSNWNEEMKLHVDEVEEILAEFLPEQKGVYFERIIDAMRYSFFAGGKIIQHSYYITLLQKFFHQI